MVEFGGTRKEVLITWSETLYFHLKVKVKWSRYRPGVAQRVGRGIALLFHDGGTRRGWMVSSTPRPHFTSGQDPVPILQEDGWAPGPVWTGGKSRPHRDSIPDRPARSQSPYRLSYRAHTQQFMFLLNVPLKGFYTLLAKLVFNNFLFIQQFTALCDIYGYYNHNPVTVQYFNCTIPCPHWNIRSVQITPWLE